MLDKQIQPVKVNLPSRKVTNTTFTKISDVYKGVAFRIPEITSDPVFIRPGLSLLNSDEYLYLIRIDTDGTIRVVPRRLDTTLLNIEYINLTIMESS